MKKNTGMSEGTDVRDRAKGALVAAIVLDAYGSPRQFKQRMQTDKSASPDMEPCSTFGLGPGFFTDDGSQILCCMDSFVRCGGYFDVQDFAETLLRWLRDGYMSSTGHSFDVGGATASALYAFGATGSIKNGGEETQGNGSLMRAVAPALIGIFKGGLDEVTHDASDVTHNSKRVRETIDIFNAVVRNHVLDGAATDALREKVCRFTFDTVPNCGWCVSSLEAALWAFYRYPTLEDGARALASASGDSDTICSIFGAIAGSLYGFSAIPERWLNKLQKKDAVLRLVDNFLDSLGLAA